MNIKVIWLDEFIRSEENLDYLSRLKSYFSKSEGYELLNEGLENFPNQAVNGYQLYLEKVKDILSFFQWFCLVDFMKYLTLFKNIVTI